MSTPDFSIISFSILLTETTDYRKLRALFAGLAMAATMAYWTNDQQRAIAAVQAADALIAELEKAEVGK